MEIDIEKLRNDLINYFGTATTYNQLAYVKLIEIENASFDKLIEIAINNNFNLEDYEIKRIKF